MLFFYLLLNWDDFYTVIFWVIFWYFITCQLLWNVSYDIVKNKKYESKKWKSNIKVIDVSNIIKLVILNVIDNLFFVIIITIISFDV